MSDDPLERIDDIAWDELSHAYGSAEDVPDELRGFLASADEGLNAYDFVVGSLWHQGSVYSATAKAIPFLVALLGAERVHRRGGLAAALMLIAENATPPIEKALTRSKKRLAAVGERHPDLAEVVDRIIERDFSEDENERDELLGYLESLEIDPPDDDVHEPPAAEE